MSGALPTRAFEKAAKIPKDEIRQKLQSAVTSAIGGGPVNAYKKVAVGMIHFANDDIGVVPLENELASTFVNFYGIHDIRRIVIPRNVRNTILYLNTTLLEPLAQNQNNEANCLLILVFSGHGVSVRTETRDPRADLYNLELW